MMGGKSRARARARGLVTARARAGRQSRLPCNRASKRTVRQALPAVRLHTSFRCFTSPVGACMIYVYPRAGLIPVCLLFLLSSSSSSIDPSTPSVGPQHPSPPIHPTSTRPWTPVLCSWTSSGLLHHPGRILDHPSRPAGAPKGYPHPA